MGEKRLLRIISGQNRGTKLYTLEGEHTRPTLDRVKEPLFNIINFKLEDAIVLDLFAGSGALGLESLSRGAEKAIFCDNSNDAINIINKNIEKTRHLEDSIVINKNYEKALEEIKIKKILLDIIFIDPPYESNFYYNSLELIKKYELLKKDGIIILETDDEKRILNYIDNEYFDIYDIRKYGRAYLVFLNRKG